MKSSESQVCEACGVTAEMGYMIAEGDDVAEVVIYAQDKDSALTEFNAYLSIAKETNENVVHDLDMNSDFSLDPLTVKLKFECSAEKLIFELKSRSLAK